jgi:hypothetical protein
LALGCPEGETRCRDQVNSGTRGLGTGSGRVGLGTGSGIGDGSGAGVGGLGTGSGTKGLGTGSGLAGLGTGPGTPWLGTGSGTDGTGCTDSPRLIGPVRNSTRLVSTRLVEFVAHPACRATNQAAKPEAEEAGAGDDNREPTQRVVEPTQPLADGAPPPRSEVNQRQPLP